MCVCGHVRVWACAHSGLRLLPGLILSECVPTRLRVSSGKRRTSCRKGRRDGEGGREEEEGRGSRKRKTRRRKEGKEKGEERKRRGNTTNT